MIKAIQSKYHGLGYWEKFLLKLIISYCVLMLIEIALIENPWFGDQLNSFITYIIAVISKYTLIPFGFETSYILRGIDAQLFIDGHKSVFIGHSCNSFSLFKAFLALILSTGTKQKWWFLLGGLASILVINGLRVAGLALIYEYFPEQLDFHHKYVFTIVVYTWIFLLFLWWVKNEVDGKNSN